MKYIFFIDFVLYSIPRCSVCVLGMFYEYYLSHFSKLIPWNWRVFYVNRIVFFYFCLLFVSLQKLTWSTIIKFYNVNSIKPTTSTMTALSLESLKTIWFYHVVISFQWVESSRCMLNKKKITGIKCWFEFVWKIKKFVNRWGGSPRAIWAVDIDIEVCLHILHTK